MFPRILALCLALVLAAFPAFGVDSGKAEGTVTINRKPVKLKYAFAKKEKDFDKKDRYVVVLTDRAISRSVLNDDMRFSNAAKTGAVVALQLRFDEKKEIEGAAIYSKTLQHGSLPASSSNVLTTGVAFTKDAVDGAASSTEELSFFTDVAEFKVKFNGTFGAEGKFGENALAAKELSASAPKVADGAAVGTLKIDGKTVKLAHAIARTAPNAFDEKKKDVVVLLTDKPATAEMLLDDSKLFGAARDGSLQGLIVKIDSDETPYHLQVLDAKAAMQLSGSGIFNFDATDFSHQHATARFYTDKEQDFMGQHKYSYDVTFAVPVQALVAPSEKTVDASTGTKLPAGGGDPGKAYMAFDKAARAGNLKELKKFASKERPLPDVTEAEMKEMLELIKMMRPAKLKVTGGFVSGDHATLSVDAEEPGAKGAKASKMTGTIEMTLEDGVWKIVAEKWKS